METVAVEKLDGGAKMRIYSLEVLLQAVRMGASWKLK